MSGRIPSDFISDLLARVDIVDVIDSRVKLKKRGNNHIACCPFHQEKTPSFSVSQSKQFFHCFGCGESGNAIGFLMKYDRLDFVDAIEELASSQGLDVPYESSNGKNRLQRDTKVNLYELMDKISQFYQIQLTYPTAEAANTYLNNRGVSSEIIAKYQIGFASKNSLINRIKDRAEQFETLSLLGMLGQNEDKKYYERFRDRIMFPIRDKRGRTIGFGGRVIENILPKYLNSPETVLFQKSKHLYGFYEAINSSPPPSKIIIVEGYMDVVALAQFGVINSVATLGTATSKEHLQLLFRSVDTVICCYDGDKAGRDAAYRALQAALPILEDGKQIQFTFLPEGEDPDTLVRKIGKTQFEQLLDDAMGYDEFLFETLIKDKELDNKQGITKLSAQAIPLIAQVPGITHQLLLKRQLGNRIGLRDSVQIEQLFHAYLVQQSRKPKHDRNQRADFNSKLAQPFTSLKTIPSNSKALTSGLSEKKNSPNLNILLMLLIQNPHLVDLVPSTEGLDENIFSDLAIFNYLIELSRSKNNLSTGQLLVLIESDEDLNSIPNLSEFVKKFAAIQHEILEEYIEDTFLESLANLYDELLEVRQDELISKSKLAGKLSLEEQQELQALTVALKKN
ncbi:DNA primase [Thorsellia kenyensis]|uniref:DNA primase n=1 Tax=Thorsellia kenyensis TaxID=1549888 RepID=A0ABV6CDQ6_9GAMM